jgi:hypothetical protein
MTTGCPLVDAAVVDVVGAGVVVGAVMLAWILPVGGEDR